MTYDVMNCESPSSSISTITLLLHITAFTRSEFKCEHDLTRHPAPVVIWRLKYLGLFYQLFCQCLSDARMWIVEIYGEMKPRFADKCSKIIHFIILMIFSADCVSFGELNHFEKENNLIYGLGVVSGLTK